MKTDDKFLILLKDFIKNLAISVVVVIILTQFIMQPVRVEGSSMYPNLMDSEVGFSNIIGLNMQGINRFDVVIISMDNPNKNIVKRVIGLPGETIEVKEDKLYINGKVLDEPHLNNDYANDYRNDNHGIFTQKFGPFTIPDDEYFVLGDNRPKSSDSREYGSFKQENIKSRSVFVIFPFNRIRNVGK